jgi:hypothetical protein
MLVNMWTLVAFFPAEPTAILCLARGNALDRGEEHPLRSVIALLVAGVATATLACVVVACGGATSTDLLDPPSTTGSGSSSSGGSGTPEASMSGTPDATTGEDDATTGDDVSVGPMEAAVVDASPVEASPESGPSLGLLCATGTMKVYCQGTDACCITIVGFAATCEAPSSCIGGSTVRCASASDCSTGQVCCMTSTTGFGGTTYSSECTGGASCTGLTKSELCDPTASNPCPNGETCSASNLTGYDSCH